MFFSRLLTSCFFLSLTESSEVIWGTVGGSATIKCRISSPKAETLILMKGLRKEIEFVYKSSISNRFGSPHDVKERLSISGAFPNHDIHISDLKFNDTSAYWCIYKTFVPGSGDFRINETSVALLVVPPRPTDPTGPPAADICPALVQVAIGISSTVLIAILLLLLACIIKKKLLKRVMYVPHSSAADVYEEMRGTVRR